ncbi:MAG: universal stress protein [Saonia sp.]
MKTILLPTDFSDNAWNAIFYALKLYQAIPCHFYIMHTYDPNPKNVIGARASVRLGMLLESLQKASEAGLAKTERYLEENHTHKNHKFEFLSIKNSVHEAIKEVQQKKDIDFIIMGTQGATGAKQIFMGSNTVKVIRSIRSCPVIAVPEDYNFQTINRIVFPSDYTRFYDQYELLPLIDLASLWKAQIRIFHIAKDFSMISTQELNQKMLGERLKDLEYEFYEFVIKTNIADGIHDFAQENKADMIALVHYKKSFMEKLTQEPIVTKLGFSARVPLLVLPELA